MTACAIAAILAQWMLPAAHVHAAHDGPPVVHRHVIDVEGAHAGVSFDDHHEAIALEPTYNVERAYSVDRPAATVVATICVAPNRRLVAGGSPLTRPLAHSPPVRVESLRAPPA